MTGLTLDHPSWNAGYTAGYNLHPCQPPAGLDAVSWLSGYVEGKGDRETRKPPQPLET